MENLIALILTRFRDENGQSLTEFGLILGLIAVVCIIAITALGGIIVDQLDLFNAAFGS